MLRLVPNPCGGRTRGLPKKPDSTPVSRANEIVGLASLEEIKIHDVQCCGFSPAGKADWFIWEKVERVQAHFGCLHNSL